MTEGKVWDVEDGDSKAVIAIKARLRWAYENNNKEHGYPWNEGARAYLDAAEAVRKVESDV